MLILCRKANRQEIAELAEKLMKSDCKQIHLRILFGATMGQTLWYAYQEGAIDSLKTEEGYMEFYRARFKKYKQSS